MLLRSTETKSSDRGRYAYITNEKTRETVFDFIPENGFEVTIGRQPSLEEISILEDANKPANLAFIITQLSRLALHKHSKAGESTASAFFYDLASDIGEAGELAVLESCARLRRSESPYYPASNEIIKMIERVTAEINGVIKSILPVPEKTKPVDPENFVPPTEEEKRNVSDLIAQCVRQLEAAE